MDALDIILPPTPQLLHNVEDFLSQNNIKHESLTLLADQTQNLAVTDNKNVFVKVYRRKDGINEPIYTQLAYDRGAHTPILHAYSDWCSVWQYMNIDILPYSKLKEALTSVRQVHELTRNEMLVEKVDYELAKQVVLGRLTKVEDNKFSQFLQQEIENICEALKMETNNNDVVFTHGDLQFKNMGVNENRPLIFDWEICKMACVEFELSKIEENLYTQKLWSKDLIQELYGVSLNLKLLHLHTRLRYVQNMAFFLERNAEKIAKQGFDAYKEYIRVSY